MTKYSTLSFLFAPNLVKLSGDSHTIHGDSVQASLMIKVKSHSCFHLIGRKNMSLNPRTTWYIDILWEVLFLEKDMISFYQMVATITIFLMQGFQQPTTLLVRIILIKTRTAFETSQEQPMDFVSEWYTSDLILTLSHKLIKCITITISPHSFELDPTILNILQTNNSNPCQLMWKMWRS